MLYKVFSSGCTLNPALAGPHALSLIVALVLLGVAKSEVGYSLPEADRLSPTFLLVSLPPYS